MSYRSYVGGPTTGYTNETYGFPTTYMMNDIRALQEMYGADFTTNSSNTVYKWSPTTGEFFIDGVAQGQPGGAGAPASANIVFMTVWDGGGNDTYDFSNYTTARPNRQSQSRRLFDDVGDPACLSRQQPVRSRQRLQRLSLQQRRPLLYRERRRRQRGRHPDRQCRRQPHRRRRGQRHPDRRSRQRHIRVPLGLRNRPRRRL
jgi:hypothetical protein